MLYYVILITFWVGNIDNRMNFLLMSFGYLLYFFYKMSMSDKYRSSFNCNNNDVVQKNSQEFRQYLGY